ncbi:MAG: hypothetical protein KDC35_20530 [Acidobacteria bacterium]|nr:hypothetical protein [Acidobacteriota bacterium]
MTVLCIFGLLLPCDLVFPWVTHNGQYDSEIVVNEIKGVQVELVLTATRANGDSAQVTHQLMPYETWHVDASVVFAALGEGPGYVVRMQCDATTISAAYVVRLLAGSSGRSPAQANVVQTSSATQHLLYNYLPSDMQFQSAIVVANMGDEVAHLTMRAYQEGIKAGEVTLQLHSGRPFAALASELFPHLVGSIYAVVSADQPILGSAFIFNSLSEPSMANAQPLAVLPMAPDPDPNGVWVRKRPSPRWTSEMPHVALNDELWVIAGAEFGVASDAVSIYNSSAISGGKGSRCRCGDTIT